MDIVSIPRPQVNTVVYGTMSRDRLGPADWTNAGLKALAGSGFTALKADTLAKALGVSRGSFYWHFPDVEAFHRSVLEAWEKIATHDIIAIVEARQGSAAVRLHALATIVFAAEGSLERQMRAWAAQDLAAAAIQERVDLRRIDYVEGLFRAAGFVPRDAKTRALFLYHALIGQFAMGKPGSLPPEEIGAMVDLLLGGGVACDPLVPT
jgi:AcrR family transcriptional regulator